MTGGVDRGSLCYESELRKGENKGREDVPSPDGEQSGEERDRLKGGKFGAVNRGKEISL